jgi:hypothetical protein
MNPLGTTPLDTNKVKVGSIDILVVDEETGLPVPGLAVTLKEQWSDINTLETVTRQTNPTGWINLERRLDRNLLFKYVSMSDSGFFLPRGVLEVTSEPLYVPYFYEAGSFMRFRPIVDEPKKKQFRVALPRWSEINIDFFQDSLYKPTMSKSNLFLTGAVYVLDSVGKINEPVEFFSRPLSPLAKSTGQIQIPVYAGRAYAVRWEVIEVEVPVYIYDDGNVLWFRQGELTIPRTLARQTTSAELRF